MQKIIAAALVLSSAPALAQSQTTLVDEMVAQKTYELIPEQSSGVGRSWYPCPEQLEAVMSPYAKNVVSFNYADGSNEDRSPSNAEFAIVNLEKANAGNQKNKEYDTESDTHIRERALTTLTSDLLYHRDYTIYRDGIVSFFAGFGRPFRVTMKRKEEISAFKTPEGMTLVKTEIDYLDSKESSERNCVYQKAPSAPATAAATVGNDY